MIFNKLTELGIPAGILIGKAGDAGIKAKKTDRGCTEI